jgi:hypothetical protein
VRPAVAVWHGHEQRHQTQPGGVVVGQPAVDKAGFPVGGRVGAQASGVKWARGACALGQHKGLCDANAKASPSRSVVISQVRLARGWSPVGLFRAVPLVPAGDAVDLDGCSTVRMEEREGCRRRERRQRLGHPPTGEVWASRPELVAGAVRSPAPHSAGQPNRSSPDVPKRIHPPLTGQEAWRRRRCPCNLPPTAKQRKMGTRAARTVSSAPQAGQMTLGTQPQKFEFDSQLEVEGCCVVHGREPVPAVGHSACLCRPCGHYTHDSACMYSKGGMRSVAQ